MSLYQNLINFTPTGSDPLQAFRAKIGEAENLFVQGQQQHGQASLLRVFTLTALIHKGFSIGKAQFDVSKAQCIARKLFNRLPTHDGTTKLPTLADSVIEAWLSDIPMFLRPYAFKADDQETPRVLAWNVKRKAAYGAFSKAGETPEAREHNDRVQNVLDLTGQSRAQLKSALELACLLTVLDPDNVLLPQFSETDGLLVKEAHLMHQKRKENNDLITYSPFKGPDATVYIPAVSKRQQFAIGIPDVAGGQAQNIRATLEQLRRAWITPKPVEQQVDDRLNGAAEGMEAMLSPSRATKLTAQETLILNRIRNAINAHDTREANVDKLKEENREKAALAVVQQGKIKAKDKREPTPGYMSVDKDGKAISEEALKAS